MTHFGHLRRRKTLVFPQVGKAAIKPLSLSLRPPAFERSRRPFRDRALARTRVHRDAADMPGCRSDDKLLAFLKSLEQSSALCRIRQPVARWQRPPFQLVVE